MNRKFIGVILSVSILFTFLSCEINLTPDLDPNSSSNNQKNGSLSGKAVFSNSDDNSSIYITLDKYEGERSAAVLKANGLYDKNCYSIGTSDSDSRSIAGYQYCDKDGNFSFKNLEIGVYTVYAQSEFSKKRAVKTDVIVKETGTTVLDTMQLVATGSISGTITLDNSTDKNDGFIVFISGTSYYGITDKSGNFKIENVPAQKGYPIVINYKSFEYKCPDKIEVAPNKDTALTKINFTTEQINASSGSGSGSGSGTGGTSGSGTGSGTGGTSGNDNKDCTIRYVLNGGTAGSNSPSIAKYGEPAVTLVAPTKKDSAFLGWYSNEDFSGDAITQVEANGAPSIMLFAKWECDCKITYFLNGGTAGSNSPSIAKYGEPAVTLVAPTKTNYIFDGWYTSEDYSGTAVTQVLADGKLSVYLFAKWICKITYELDGGTLPSEYPSESVFGEPAVTLPTPTKADYSFAGWYLESDFSGEQITKVSANGEYSSVKLYAQWIEEIQYDESDFLDIVDALSNSEEDLELFIPESVQDSDYFIPDLSEGMSYFWNCIKLSSIQVEETNPYYDSRNDCNALIETNTNKLILGCKNTVIPDTVTTIGSYAFDNIDYYEGSVVIEVPDSVTELEPYAFANTRCGTNLDETTIILGNGITKIPEGAFQYSGITSIVIPEGVTEIADNAFEGCEALVSIQLPKSLKKIGNNAFNTCTNLKSIEIPSNLEEIGTYAFTDCESLKEVKGLETSKITVLPGQLFYRCYSLESVIIPETVTEIGETVFYECNKLLTINIPKNVNSITQVSGNLFYGCISLRKITVDSENTTYDSRNNCNAIIETATNTLITGCCRTTIPEDVETIGKYALNGLPYTTIVIPNSVTTINGYSALFTESGAYKAELETIYFLGTFEEWYNMNGITYQDYLNKYKSKITLKYYIDEPKI